jgi:hypothetical protein
MSIIHVSLCKLIEGVLKKCLIMARIDIIIVQPAHGTITDCVNLICKDEVVECTECGGESALDIHIICRG